MTGTTAMFGRTVVPTATTTTWVHGTRYIAALVRANAAETLTGVALLRIAELEREAAQADATMQALGVDVARLRSLLSAQPAEALPF